MTSEERRFDERQLRERGRAFRLGFAVCMIMLIAMYCLTDFFELALPTRFSFYVCFWLPLTVTSVYMIVKRAYDGITDYRGMALFTFLGIISVVMAVFMIVRGEPMIENGLPTPDAGTAFMCACVFIMAAVYWIYHVKDVREYNAEIAEEKARDKAGKTK